MITTRTFAARGTAAMLAALMATTAGASSHREAPAITLQPKIDGTDFYMFRSYEPGREGYVTFLANYQPIQTPYGGPNYFTMDENAVYEIHIDNDGDAIEDITFQFDFDNRLTGGTGIALPIGDEMVAIPLRQAGPVTSTNNAAQNELESYTVTRIDGDRRSGEARPVLRDGSPNFAKPLDYIGTKTLPDYEAYAARHVFDAAIPGCQMPGRVFVGQRAEAFAVNLGELFDLFNLFPTTEFIEQSRDNDDLVGKANVTTIAIEVPIGCITEGDDPVIGAWTTASKPQGRLLDAEPSYGETAQFGGPLVQQSRLSAPLVNEVVIGLPDKDLFNSAEPMIDGALATYVTNPTLPALIDILFRDIGGFEENIAPALPRNDLVAAFLTGIAGLNQPANVTASEMMRLNTAIPPTPRAAQSNFGVVGEDLAGFPNGRRPGDDVVDIALRVVMGALCHDVPLGAELGVPGAVEDTDTDLVNLGLCPNGAADAPVGDQPLTDGAPIDATELGNSFPYLNTPLPGAEG